MATTVDPLLIETINQMFADACEPERVMRAEHEFGGFDAALWQTLESGGLTLVGVPEASGGSGGTLHDAAAIMKAAGYHAAPVPLADTLTVAWLAATAGHAVPAGPLALAIANERSTWAPNAVSLLAVGGDSEPSTVLGAAAAFVLTDVGRNYAGEPHATVSAPNEGTHHSGGAVNESAARAAMALSRALLMAGALQRAVELSVQYVLEREQFGRPIGKFQVLQHYLAQMAGEACASEAAADNAVDIVGAGMPAAEQRRAIAAAKAVSGRAVSTMNRLAHQIHGAIGFTDEHRLQLTTRRLWSWRDEHGTESEWSAVLGRDLVAAGSAALWPMLTTWPPAAD